MWLGGQFQRIPIFNLDIETNVNDTQSIISLNDMDTIVMEYEKHSEVTFKKLTDIMEARSGTKNVNLVKNLFDWFQLVQAECEEAALLLVGLGVGNNMNVNLDWWRYCFSWETISKETREH